MVNSAKSGVLCVACLLVPVMVGGSEAGKLTPEEIAAGVQRHYQEIQDLQANFHQRTYLSMMDRIKEASGRLYLKMSGKMRWDYLEGQKKTVVINDQTLLFYDPEERQATVTDLTRMPNSDELLTFLTGVGDLQRDFRVTDSPPSQDIPSGHARIHLFPRSENSQWRRLSLLVDLDTFQVVQSAFEGIQGDQTVVDYSRIRTNVGLPDDIFQLEIPEGTDILHYPPPEEVQ